MGGGDGKPAQNVVILRHGDRIDQLQPEWAEGANRPWDPPLHDGGEARAWNTGKTLRRIGFPIHRVLVSPFLRCRQTAAEVVAALCAVDATAMEGMRTSSGIAIDPSVNIKVSIEYGLCETVDRPIPPEVEPTDDRWFDDIPQLLSLFPKGTIDHDAPSIFEPIPGWEESIENTRKRFARVIQVLADRYPEDNLLLVTHGECVAVSVSTYLRGAQVTDVECCAFSHLKRRTTHTSCQKEHGAQTFELCHQSGVSYFTSI